MTARAARRSTFARPALARPKAWTARLVTACVFLLGATAPTPGNDSTVSAPATTTTANAAPVEAPADMVVIPAGIYRPFLRAGSDPREIEVAAFRLDTRPVTIADFLEFVRAQPAWRRSTVKPLFADAQYLKAWAADLDPGPGVNTNAPVTQVSWFAARAYARWRDKRLPTLAEWERAASASSIRLDGENDPAFVAEQLAWVSSPARDSLPSVGGRRPNLHGVHDLHGLVWEWVADFNTAMMTGDARNDTGLDRQLFCGAGSQAARNPADYATFLRFAFRSSLRAAYTVHNLGFRCARDL